MQGGREEKERVHQSGINNICTNISLISQGLIKLERNCNIN